MFPWSEWCECLFQHMLFAQGFWILLCWRLFFLLLGWENSGGKIGCSAGVGATSRLWRSAGGILRGVLGLAFRPADRKSPKKFRIHTLKYRIHTFLALMMFNAFECIWCHWPPALLAFARLIQTCFPTDYPRWHCHRHLRCKGPGKLAQSALPWNISFWDCLKAWRARLIIVNYIILYI